MEYFLAPFLIPPPPYPPSPTLFLIKTKENNVFEKNGKFLSLENKSETFSVKEQNPLYRSAGFYRDWPDSRFIYVNADQQITLIANEEDHLKLILKISIN